MKTTFLVIVLFLYILPCFSQQNLLPAFPNEISYQGERAYFNGALFTGVLVGEKTNVKWGVFKNGYKMGSFTEYYANGKKKSEGNFVNGQKEGTHIQCFENGILTSKINYEFGKIINGEYTIYNSDSTPSVVKKYLSNKLRWVLKIVFFDFYLEKISRTLQPIFLNRY